MKDFCLCANLACALHPSNQDKSCSPGIANNLRLQEIPNCFVKLVKEDVVSRPPLRLKHLRMGS